MATATQTFRLTFSKWLKSAPETASLKIVKIEDDIAEMEFSDHFRSFTLTVPDSPDSNFYVHCEDESMEKWMTEVNDFCERCGQDVNGLLDFIASSFLGAVEDMDEHVGNDYGDEYDYGGDYEDYAAGFEPIKAPEPKKEIDLVEQELQKQRADKLFIENIGTKGATMRLFDDLKHIRKAKSKELGFSCEPVMINGLMNLYEWEVRMFDFEGPLAQDMKEYQKKTGKNFVTLSMKFSGDYPFRPPFIRVIEPRFKFRTGHVTLGGAICMQLLTISGWTANNDITSILIQVRAEIGSIDGGARLAPPGDQSTYTPYSEQEAWNAFYRAASTHGWKTEGLGSNMFPKV